MKKNQTIQSVKILILALVIGLGAQFIHAQFSYSPPPCNSHTLCNTLPPINVGTGNQIKTDKSGNGLGGLGMDRLLVLDETTLSSNTGVTSIGSSAGTVYWTKLFTYGSEQDYGSEIITKLSNPNDQEVCVNKYHRVILCIPNPKPSITSISPSSKVVSSPTYDTGCGFSCSLTVFGSGFNSQSKIYFDGSALDTTYDSTQPGQLRAYFKLTTANPGDTFPVFVFNSLPSGGASNIVYLTIIKLSTGSQTYALNPSGVQVTSGTLGSGSPSTFTPLQNLKYTITVVAGGGGGGASHTPALSYNYNSLGGGGGGGSAAGRSSISLTAGTPYSVVVGAGGVGGAAGSNNGQPGSDSSFGNLVKVTGGLGGTYGDSTQSAGIGGAHGYVTSGSWIGTGGKGDDGGADTSGAGGGSGNGDAGGAAAKDHAGNPGGSGSGGSGGDAAYAADHSGGAGGAGYITITW